MFHHRTWERAAGRLAENGVELRFAHQSAASGALEGAEAQGLDLLIVEAEAGLPGCERVLTQGRRIAHRLGLAAEMPSDFTTFAPETVVRFKEYVSRASCNNFVNGILYLVHQAGGRCAFAPPEEVETTGIYHPRAAPHVFSTWADYAAWTSSKDRYGHTALIGILFHYTQFVEENTADVDAVITALENHGMMPVGVFFDGVEGSDGHREPPWLDLFKAAGVDVILNWMAGRLVKNADRLHLLEGLDVPIIQLLRAHSQSPDQWRADPQGLPAVTAVYSLAQPETNGVITPIPVAGSRQDPLQPAGIGYRPFLPVSERIDTLCRRVKRWVTLGRTANRDKRITFVLHNNPCKGMEATVGLAAGLDTFESLARVLRQMKKAGYDVGTAPQRGSDILDAIMCRKAVSEFRWTTVDEIVRKGGALYLMDEAEYLPWFESLPESARTKVLNDWGPFPGKGMAYRDNGRDVLVITGLQYGNIRIMAQPKRGCYGAKCNGEVCRILHDPALAPPHHWLATYKYIQDHSDAVVHFGTEGALEYLPGKQIGLSDACFPEISIGDLPNLYVFVLDATGEGMTAKRRGQAVLVDHLSPVYRPAPLDDVAQQLEALLDQYYKAESMGESARLAAIGEEMAPFLVRCGLVEKAPDNSSLSEAVGLARRRLQKIRQSLMPEGLHLLGTAPDTAATAKILATILRTPPPDLPDLATLCTWFGNTAADAYEGAAALIEGILRGDTSNVPKEHRRSLVPYCKAVGERLAHCAGEIDRLLQGLDGGFISPGLSGALSRGNLEVLPTGRNFYATDVTTLPTRTAWKIGRRMADQLLLKYWGEEKRFPESVGISIWSSDAFKSDGELLCQILALMGARPVWDGQGRVRDVQAMDLAELTLTLPDGSRQARPRVDVVIQTSSIMRDLVPNFCELMDRAVVLLSGLDEPEECNHILKHAREEMARLRRETRETLSEARIRRMATLRVFSSAPGTYGLGVGLALDASAWQDRKDLAEVYINWGGHAYTADAGHQAVRYGLKAQQSLADQLARVEVTFMKQASAEYDVLDCGCYAVSQGGMAAAAAAVGGRQPKLYWADSSPSPGAEIGDLAEAIQASARAKLLNPAWIKHMRRHGHQGAQAASSRVNTLFKWSATSGQVPKGLFDAVVRTYILDEENRAWLRKENPHALEEITRRLLEAASRELWDADADLLAAVQSAALEIEGDMEETMGEVQEEFQGGKVDVLTARDVEKWKMEWKIGDR
ncbi:MAG: Cobaltochelatase [Desulfacinum sp.]|jgi:cobaltochelatase CobN|nr:Cobaltochelatase [Desulfacinum sp.]